MTEFQRDLETIIENTSVAANEITFHMRHFDRIENTGVESLCLDTRGFHGLKRHKIDLVGDVVDSWEKLRTLNQVGETTVKRIKNAVLAMYYSTLDIDEKKEFWRDAFGR